ncbi:MAG TPA: hypothetical protein VGL59_13050 [Polyangia bacterium]|jgi:hypothetical protein
MKMSAFAMVALFTGGVLGGCSGGSSSTGTPAQVSISQLPTVWPQTVCTQNFKCASAADIMSRKMSDCITSNTQAWQFVASSIQDGQAKGRLGYDATLMGTCLSDLAAQSCADWVTGLDHPAECNGAFIAKVNVGGACQSDFECINGVCDGADSSTKPPTDGMCKAKVGHGAACTFDDTCVDTDYCDSTTSVCIAKKAGGAACQSDDECGNSCNTDTNQCSGYGGCAITSVTPRGTLLSLFGFGFVVVMAAHRRRRR